jgi:hypothetical protein
MRPSGIANNSLSTRFMRLRVRQLTQSGSSQEILQAHAVLIATREENERYFYEYRSLSPEKEEENKQELG